MSRKVFSDNIAPETEQAAFLLLETEVSSPSKEDVFTLWQAACAYDGKDPNTFTHIFSTGNPFAHKAVELKAKLQGNAYVGTTVA